VGTTKTERNTASGAAGWAAGAAAAGNTTTNATESPAAIAFLQELMRRFI
jgi:Flp pilus assembly protein TadG